MNGSNIIKYSGYFCITYTIVTLLLYLVILLFKFTSGNILLPIMMMNLAFSGDRTSVIFIKINKRALTGKEILTFSFSSMVCALIINGLFGWMYLFITTPDATINLIAIMKESLAATSFNGLPITQFIFFIVLLFIYNGSEKSYKDMLEKGEI